MPAISTWCFALTVVRRGDRFLLVQEKDGSWSLPGGRMEPGETFPHTARRETLEEAGVSVVLAGILRVEHSPNPYGARCRVLFLAHPADDTPPKAAPDGETLGASWFSVEEAARLRLRGEETLRWLRAVAGGAPVYPLALLTYEGAPLGASQA